MKFDFKWAPTAGGLITSIALLMIEGVSWWWLISSEASLLKIIVSIVVLLLSLALMALIYSSTKSLWCHFIGTDIVLYDDEKFTKLHEWCKENLKKSDYCDTLLLVNQPYRMMRFKRTSVAVQAKLAL